MRNRQTLHVTAKGSQDCPRQCGIVVLDDADYPSIRKLCRYVESNRAYRFKAATPLRWSSMNWRRRAGLAKRHAEKLGRSLAGQRTRIPVGSRCVAFQKFSDDARRWDHHRAF